jgi:hypothetical protein
MQTTAALRRISSPMTSLCAAKLSLTARSITHFQNGIAEKRIRDVQDLARTMMIHARHHWPNAITANLWPYALKIANDVHMSMLILKEKGAATPLERFSGVNVRPNISSFHPFGCPVYVRLTPTSPQESHCPNGMTEPESESTSDPPGTHAPLLWYSRSLQDSCPLNAT